MRAARVFWTLVVATLAFWIPAPAEAQQITLFATGEVEWSTAGYHPPAAYVGKLGDWEGEIPFLELEENLDSIRARLGSKVVDNPNAHHRRSVQHGIKFATNEENFRYPFLKIADLIRSADIAVAPLAMPLSDRAIVRRTGVLGSPEFADALAWAGFDVIAISNNRLLDAGRTGLMDTGPALERAGLKWSGAGKDLEEARRPTIVEKDGIKLAFFSYTYGLFGYGVDGFARPNNVSGVMAMDPFLIREDIRRWRDKVDYIVLSLHWGVIPDQNTHPEQRKFAQDLIDRGADIIIGTHTHVPHGIEIYKGKPIMYSIANFAFNHSHDFFMDNYAVKMTLEKNRSISKLELIPVGGGHKYLDIFQPHVVTGERAQTLLRDIQARSAGLDTKMTIEGDIGVIRPASAQRILGSQGAP